jgi:phosphoribosylcarboxyaminoimidazole (NCAIR) mutase
VQILAISDKGLAEKLAEFKNNRQKIQKLKIFGFSKPGEI